MIACSSRFSLSHLFHQRGGYMTILGTTTKVFWNNNYDTRSRILFSTLTPEEAGRRAKVELEELVAAAHNDDSDNGQQQANTKKKILSSSADHHLSTQLSHAGMVSSKHNTPMAPPLHLSSTYTRPADGIYKDTDSIYSRMDNPTRLLLEDVMYNIETYSIKKENFPKNIAMKVRQQEEDDQEGTTTYAFSSGMMAVSSILLAHDSPITVLFPKDLYHGVPTVAIDVFERHNVQTLHVDMSNVSNVIDTIKHVQHNNNNDSNYPKSQIIVWMESPSNPLCQIIDIETICTTIRRTSFLNNGFITTVVDSTLAPPIITQPILLGADIVVHSATKYLAGHSDVLLGIVTSSPITKRGIELSLKLQQVQIATGGVASSFDSWLTLRGLRTLHVRLQRQCQSALQVAKFLNQHPLIQKVHYPGLLVLLENEEEECHNSHNQQYTFIKKQMKNDLYGGIISFELESENLAMAVTGGLQLIQRATSLGGTETLIEHRVSIEPENRKTSPPGLLRLSIGLENVNDIMNDLSTALDIAKKVCS